MKRLKRERKRTEKLLYQLLPRSVAEQLRRGESAVACCEQFDAVSILFTDLVGFTNICSTMQPLNTFHLLNEMFTSFDLLIDQHGVYKVILEFEVIRQVETIGDAYMVVGGAPLRTVFHAEYVVDCARSFIKAVAELDKKVKEYKLQVRWGFDPETPRQNRGPQRQCHCRGCWLEDAAILSFRRDRAHSECHGEYRIRMFLGIA